MLHRILTEPNYSPIRQRIISHIGTWRDGVSLWLAVPKILYDNTMCASLFIRMIQYTNVYVALKHGWTQIVTQKDKLVIIHNLRHSYFFWHGKKGFIPESLRFVCNYIVPIMSKCEIGPFIRQISTMIPDVSELYRIMQKLQQSFPTYGNMYSILYGSLIRNYYYEFAHKVYVCNVPWQQCIHQKRDKYWSMFIRHNNRFTTVSVLVEAIMFMAQDIGLYSWYTFCQIIGKMYLMYDNATTDEKTLIKNALIQLDAMFLQRHVKRKWQRATAHLQHCTGNRMIANALPHIWSLLVDANQVDLWQL